MVLFFEHEYFHHQFNERRYIFGEKGDFVVPRAFLSRCAVCWFHVFKLFMEFLKLWNCWLLSFHICNSCYQCVLQHGQLLVVELVTYCKKYCLIKKNKNYWSFYKSIFNCPISFDIVSTTLRPCWNNVDTTLYQRCATLFRHCFNVGARRCIYVVQRSKTDVGFCFIFIVGLILFQRWSTTLKQRCSNVQMLVGLNLFERDCLSLMNLWSHLHNRLNELRKLFLNSNYLSCWLRPKHKRAAIWKTHKRQYNWFNNYNKSILINSI